MILAPPRETIVQSFRYRAYPVGGASCLKTKLSGLTLDFRGVIRGSEGWLRYPDGLRIGSVVKVPQSDSFSRRQTTRTHSGGQRQHNAEVFPRTMALEGTAKRCIGGIERPSNPDPPVPESSSYTIRPVF